RKKRDKVANQGGHGDYHRATNDVLVGDWLEVTLLLQDRLDPFVSVRGDRGNHFVEQWAREALASIELGYFAALKVRVVTNGYFLDGALGLEEITICRGRGESARSHRDRFGDGRGKTSRQ